MAGENKSVPFSFRFGTASRAGGFGGVGGFGGGLEAGLRGGGGGNSGFKEGGAGAGARQRCHAAQRRLLAAEPHL